MLMREFAFGFVVSGLQEDDSVQLQAMETAGLTDCFLASTDGVVTVSFARPATDAVEAMTEAARDLASALPDVSITRVDLDLVTTSDIAERIGRTREYVRLLAEGRRGDGTFPAPIGWVGGNQRVWMWADINEWVRTHPTYGECDAAVYPDLNAISRFQAGHQHGSHKPLDLVDSQALAILRAKAKEVMVRYFAETAAAARSQQVEPALLDARIASAPRWRGSIGGWARDLPPSDDADVIEVMAS